jgi:hypothetical protein
VHLFVSKGGKGRGGSRVLQGIDKIQRGLSGGLAEEVLGMAQLSFWQCVLLQFG